MSHLNSPVLAGMSVDISGTTVIAGAAGDNERELLTQTDTSKVEDIATDGGDLASIRKINPRRISDPARPPVDPTMATLLDTIMSGFSQKRSARVNHLFL